MAQYSTSKSSGAPAAQRESTPTGSERINGRHISQETPRHGDGLDEVRLGTKLLHNQKTLTVDPTVKKLQQRLSELGYAPSMKADGVFGPATERVVKDLQSRFSIKADGIVGEQFMKVLDAAWAERTRRIAASIPSHSHSASEPAAESAREGKRSGGVAVASAAAGIAKQSKTAGTSLTTGTGECIGPSALCHILNYERGINADPADRGNRPKSIPKDPHKPDEPVLTITNMGITADFFNDWLKKNGRPQITNAATMNATLRALDTVEVGKIYQEMLLERHKLNTLPPKLTFMMVDWVTNSGTRAIKMLQEAVGVAPDGKLGPSTIAAVNAVDCDTLMQRLREVRDADYERIAKLPGQKKNLPGWQDRLKATMHTVDSATTHKMVEHYRQNGLQGWDILDSVRYADVVLRQPPKGSQHDKSMYTMTRVLQERLNEFFGDSAIKVDGVFGAHTAQAIEKFRAHWRILKHNQSDRTWDSECQEYLDLAVKKATPQLAKR